MKKKIKLMILIYNYDNLVLIKVKKKYYSLLILLSLKKIMMKNNSMIIQNIYKNKKIHNRFPIKISYKKINKISNNY